jgi:hypothetical protein
MMSDYPVENLVERQVIYTLEINGEFFLIENVPARVDLDTGEQFFAPSTVERLHQIILDRKSPIRFAQVPVYEFAA